MWENILHRMLEQLVQDGELQVNYPSGRVGRYGCQGDLSANVRLASDAIVRRLCVSPVMGLGEGYMNGDVDVSDQDLLGFLSLLSRNRMKGQMPRWYRTGMAVKTGLRSWLQRNDPRKSKSNVAHHYDISDDLYRLFLDEDMQYSCAYFTDPAMSLEAAQTAKKQHIGRKLMIRPGDRVLDIGCGWGGLALTLARDFGAHVTGVTLSENQLNTAKARARAAGLQDQTDFRLLDYRKLDEGFDRVVSVGMLEHVGLPHFSEYFGTINQLLAPDGLAMVHTIGSLSPPMATSSWLDKYIFPGGYIPSLSDLSPAIEQSGLWMADVEILRGHYGRTIHHWRDRFEAELPTVRKMYDERFVRMWRFYLVACEATFEEAYQGVFQIQLSKKQYAVPVTRDYLYGGDGPDHRSLHAAQ